MGQSEFPNVMPRDRFKTIRAFLKLNFDGDVSDKERSEDFLWHFRSLFHAFQRSCQLLAVPLHASALDENSCLTKARTKKELHAE